MSVSSRFMSLVCLRSSALTANQCVLHGWSEAEASIVAIYLELIPPSCLGSASTEGAGDTQVREMVCVDRLQ